MKELLIGIILIFALILVIPALGLFNLNFWGVKYKDAERNIFEQSKSYNHGMQRDIQNLINSYDLADENQKESIKQTIRHRLAAYDLYDLPPQTVQQMKEREIY